MRTTRTKITGRGARGRAAPTSTSVAPSTRPGAEPPTARRRRRHGADHPGEYEVDEADLTITDPDQGDRTVDIAVWYPRTGGPFPLVVFAHGFGTSPDNYADFLAGLASSGHVVAAPRSFSTQATSSSAVDRADRVPGAGGRRRPADPGPGSEEPPAEPGAVGDGFDFNGQRLDLVAAIDVVLGQRPAGRAAGAGGEPRRSW